MLKIKDLRRESAGQLKKKLIELRNRVVKLRFDISAKSTKNHRELRHVKRSIARISTILNEKKPSKNLVTNNEEK